MGVPDWVLFRVEGGDFERGIGGLSSYKLVEVQNEVTSESLAFAWFARVHVTGCQAQFANMAVT